MEDFAATLLTDLHLYLTKCDAVDERLPECPDVEAKWPPIAEAYLPDGVREFANYPIASLGWMMFIGMAIAKFWDEDWEKYGKTDDLYTPMRDKRGFDNLDEYILDEVLDLHGDAGRELRAPLLCVRRAESGWAARDGQHRAEPGRLLPSRRQDRRGVSRFAHRDTAEGPGAVQGGVSLRGDRRAAEHRLQ